MLRNQVWAILEWYIIRVEEKKKYLGKVFRILAFSKNENFAFWYTTSYLLVMQKSENFKGVKKNVELEIWWTQNRYFLFFKNNESNRITSSIHFIFEIYYLNNMQLCSILTRIYLYRNCYISFCIIFKR